MSAPPGYGEVHGPPIGEMSRRGFMRRVLGVGVGILSLEFLVGTVNFLWPNIRGGLGGEFTAGTAQDIVSGDPQWASGRPLIFQQKIFLINVPAAKGLVEGTGEEVPDPGDQVQALYRKCPHLGCQIPQLCDASKWFECLCHGSKYTILGERRDGPAPRGMDGFAISLRDGVYVINTGEIIDGAPLGSATFDTRDAASIPHCAG
jgi:cytochrome b6-f complex iron-sulfur subunit